MNFFNNEQLSTGSEFDLGGGAFEVIPENTSLIASPKEVSWVNYDSEDHISITWTVLAPEQYKNRLVFQKLKVFDADPKKSDRAKRMLVAIDANAGGNIANKARGMSGYTPNDQDLQTALIGRPQRITVRTWQAEVQGVVKEGNWVAKVAPNNNQPVQQAQVVPASTLLPQQQQQPVQAQPIHVPQPQQQVQQPMQQAPMQQQGQQLQWQEATSDDIPF